MIDSISGTLKQKENPVPGATLHVFEFESNDTQNPPCTSDLSQPPCLAATTNRNGATISWRSPSEYDIIRYDYQFMLVNTRCLNLRR